MDCSKPRPPAAPSAATLLASGTAVELAAPAAWRAAKAGRCPPAAAAAAAVLLPAAPCLHAPRHPRPGRGRHVMAPRANPGAAMQGPASALLGRTCAPCCRQFRASSSSQWPAWCAGAACPGRFRPPGLALLPQSSRDRRRPWLLPSPWPPSQRVIASSCARPPRDPGSDVRCHGAEKCGDTAATQRLSASASGA